MLRLADDWTWDFWLADDGERYHLYFLKAPRALGDPNLRHWNVRIGHAVSENLIDWEVLDDALAPSTEPAFDDYTTWTGSVVRDDDGLWYLFYTGTSRAERGLKQRIGVATSTDLSRWRKQSRQALVVSDPRWYEQLGDSSWSGEAWRDPWVVRDPAGDGWHMLITARARTGPVDERGVIGYARSADLRSWRVMPPLSAPGAGFGHLEVPQVEVVAGQPVLLFSCLAHELAAQRRATGEGGGIWLVEAPNLLGPFDLTTARRITDDRSYAGRLARCRGGRWVLLSFRYHEGDHHFAGHLADPVPFPISSSEASRT